MSIDNMMVTVNRLPVINLETGTDWVTLFGVFLTAFIVVLGAFYNSYVFKETIKGQKNIAETNFKFLKTQGRSEFIAKQRIEWIESIREEVSLFLSVGARVQVSSQYIVNTDWVTGATSAEDLERKNVEYAAHYSDFTQALAQGRMHYCKVELLIDLEESDEQELIVAMNRYIMAAANYEPINQLGDEVTKAARKLLMNRWVLAKEMSES